MDTLSFLRKILPRQGSYVLASFYQGLTRAPVHTAHDTVESLALAAQAVDQHGINTYHACAGYLDPTLKASQGLRKASNVGWVRSHWIDLDTGEGKPYATKNAARDALIAVCKALSLPFPLVVSSGRGLHGYWVFDEDVPVEQARHSAQALFKAVTARGLQADASRTGDLASVLRPVGTRHRKDPTNPLPVKLIVDAPEIAYAAFCARVMSYLPVAPAAPVDDEWSTTVGERDYPPSSAKEIVKHCAALRDVVAAGGGVEEPLWRDMLGLVKRTTEGEELAHEWSTGDPRYNYDQTQRKLDNWTTAPPTCDRITSDGGACDGCKHRERKSPIHLGYVEGEAPTAPPEPPPAEAAATPTSASPVAHDLHAYANKMPYDLSDIWDHKNYRWSGEALEKFVKTEEADAGDWVPFARYYVYPYMSVRKEDGEYAIKFCAKAMHGWRAFEIPAKLTADPRQLATVLAGNNIWMIGKNGRFFMQAMIQDIMHTMSTKGIETRELKHFGWVEDGFVLGKTLLTPTEERAVLLSDQVPSAMRDGFAAKGTLASSIEKMNRLYNRPGAEAMQFVLLSALAAPLVKLMGADLFHGIPIALTGPSGLGKTTTALVACAMYGSPGSMLISAHEMGTTANALIQRVASAPHLPQIFDEVHGMKQADLPTLLYALSNGVPKAALRADRSFNESGSRWDTLTFITSNSNINSLLSVQERNKAEATQLRVWEIPFTANYLSDVFSGADAKAQIDDMLTNNYGTVGRYWLSAVMKVKDKVERALFKQRAKYAPNSAEMTRERFFYDTLACVMVAGVLAQQLKIFQFDLKAIETWAIAHIQSMRAARVDYRPSFEEMLHIITRSLEGRTVITETFPARRIREEKAQYVDPSKLYKPIARRVNREGWLLVTLHGFDEICAENNVDKRHFIGELERRGFRCSDAAIRADGRGRVYPFRGTTLNSAATQTRVVAIDLRAMESAASMQDARDAFDEQTFEQQHGPDVDFQAEVALH